MKKELLNSLGIIFSAKTFIIVSPAICNSVSPPNVVLIIADDMGWKQLGCYGSRFYESPDIDRLMSLGMRFTNAYSSAPVSSPTRASLMTGKYPARLHLTDYVQAPDPADKPVWVQSRQKFLPLEEKTIGEIYQERGYRTALFGKWHLSLGKSGPSTIPYNPDKQGFEETFLTFKPSRDLPLGSWQKPELDGHNTDTITSRSIDFITRNSKNPFLLVVAYDAIHDPLMERSKTIEKYRQKLDSNLPENNPVLAAMVERMDKAAGRIVKCIENNNLLSNTIIVFVSDNGGLENDASQAPLKHGKGWLYEGGIRVPFSVTWVGTISSGSISEVPVTSTDILPTLLDLTGFNPVKDIDGISLAKLLIENKPPEREAIYWHYPHYHNGPPAAAIRKGKYKLIEWYDKSLSNQSGAYELYDLETDLSEATNLSQKLPLITDSLRKDLNQWKISVKANLPTLNMAIH
jgi:uncharacterized sulfatase